MGTRIFFANPFPVSHVGHVQQLLAVLEIEEPSVMFTQSRHGRNPLETSSLKILSAPVEERLFRVFYFSKLYIYMCKPYDPSAITSERHRFLGIGDS